MVVFEEWLKRVQEIHGHQIRVKGVMVDMTPENIFECVGSEALDWFNEGETEEAYAAWINDSRSEGLSDDLDLG